MIYKEYQKAKGHLYFILYGQLQLRNTYAGEFQHKLGIGWTLGEEIMYSDEDD